MESASDRTIYLDLKKFPVNNPHNMCLSLKCMSSCNLFFKLAHIIEFELYREHIGHNGYCVNIKKLLVFIWCLSLLNLPVRISRNGFGNNM